MSDSPRSTSSDNRFLFISLVIGLILAAAGCISIIVINMNSVDTPSSAGSTRQETAQAARAQPTAPLAALGETVTVSGVSFSATEVEYDPPRGSEYVEGSHMVAVRVTVGNQTNDYLLVSAFRGFKLVDTNGVEYYSMITAMDGRLPEDALAVGGTVTGWVDFDTKTVVQAARIMFEPSYDDWIEVGLTP